MLSYKPKSIDELNRFNIDGKKYVPLFEIDHYFGMGSLNIPDENVIKLDWYKWQNIINEVHNKYVPIPFIINKKTPYIIQCYSTIGYTNTTTIEPIIWEGEVRQCTFEPIVLISYDFLLSTYKQILDSILHRIENESLGFNECYTKLIPAGDKFENLKEFIFNVRHASFGIKELINDTDRLLEDIINDDETHEIKCKLNDFEIYVTRFVSALYEYRKFLGEGGKKHVYYKRTKDYFGRVIAENEKQKDYFDFRIVYDNSNNDWNLVKNDYCKAGELRNLSINEIIAMKNAPREAEGKKKEEEDKVNLVNKNYVYLESLELYKAAYYEFIKDNEGKGKLEKLNSDKLIYSLRYSYNIHHVANDYYKVFKEIVEFIDEEIKHIAMPLIKASKSKANLESEITLPHVKKDAVEVLHQILKDYFNENESEQLKSLLENGVSGTSKLIFKSNGNRLTDTFKKLVEYEFIIGCEKKAICNWIVSNFKFKHLKTIKEFNLNTVNKAISSNENPCKSPLIMVENGTILKVNQPHIKKYNKY